MSDLRLDQFGNGWTCGMIWDPGQKGKLQPGRGSSRAEIPEIVGYRDIEQTCQVAQCRMYGTTSGVCRGSVQL